ncbi:MAG: hypothetical protein ABI175_24385 [Polyangiales bacterium]
MSRPARRCLVAFALVAWAGPIGCGGADVTAPTSDASADTSLGGDGAAFDSAPRPDSSPADFGVCPSYPETGAPAADCAACVDALCKDESVACAADDNCGKQVTCFAACKTSACQADCLSAFPSPAGKARFDCIRCRCETQCTTTTG